MKHITEFCMEALEYPGNAPAKQYQIMIDSIKKMMYASLIADKKQLYSDETQI